MRSKLSKSEVAAGITHVVSLCLACARDSTVYDALQILSSNNILAAPVFDAFNTFQGFADMVLCPLLLRSLPFALVSNTHLSHSLSFPSPPLFFSQQMLTRYVVRLCNNDVTPTPMFWMKDERLKTTTLKDLIRGSQASAAQNGTQTHTRTHGHKHPLAQTQTAPILGEYRYPISEDASLYQAFERMAREGQHHLGIMNIWVRRETRRQEG